MQKMVEVSASMVKELRERSGAAMMDCKKALVEAEGNFDKAFEVLRQRGVATASKKASRATSEGLVVGRVQPDSKLGAIVEINCETDFVARNPEFVQMCDKVVEAAISSKPQSVEELQNAKIGSQTVKEFMTDSISKTGENMNIKRLAVFQLKGEGGVGMYIHALGGKMGSLVEISSTKAVPAEEMSALTREIAMHIVSAKPQFVSREEIPAEVLENERRIESGKADLADKKPEIRDKMISGRVDKLMAERCLLEQPFVKDPNLTIAQYLKQKGSGWGAELKPARFALYILGESGDSETETNGAA
jgi:elongation factor Ts